MSPMLEFPHGWHNLGKPSWPLFISHSLFFRGRVSYTNSKLGSKNRTYLSSLWDLPVCREHHSALLLCCNFVPKKEAALPVIEDEVCSIQEICIHKPTIPKPHSPMASGARGQPPWYLPSLHLNEGGGGGWWTSDKKLLTNVWNWSIKN